MQSVFSVLALWLVSSTILLGQIKEHLYSGSGSVTRGKATTTVTNLFERGTRVAASGTIKSSDNKEWIVPANVAFSDPAFPFASDLYNEYVRGHTYSSNHEAERALSESDIIKIDTDGSIFTAYVFGDNYFEMYVNGVPVGKDPVPYTAFNSCIIRFQVKKPFTVAVKCVDWEENLGLGTERMGDDPQYIGDGGFVAVIKNTLGEIETVTDASWKAQTFYIAPIADLSCLKEENGFRYSNQCEGKSGKPDSYGVHWDIPSDWFSPAFNDSTWPQASLYSNETVGVDNKPAYTNFTEVFDDPRQDASFIWSTNLLLDNVVLLRKVVE